MHAQCKWIQVGMLNRYQVDPSAAEYLACPYRIDNETFSMPPGQAHPL